MGTTLHRLTSAVLAGSLALSATPAAALGLGLHAESDSSASANVGRRASLNAHHSANVDADAAVPARCRNFDDEDQDECVRIFKARAELKGQAKADADTHGQFVSRVKHAEERAKDRAVTTVVKAKALIKSWLKRVIHASATLAKRVCDNDDAATVRSCVADIKADVQANVSAMLDAEFTVN